VVGKNEAVPESRKDPTGIGRRALETAIIVIAGLVLVALRPLPYDVRVITLIVVYAMAGIGINVLIGYTGIVTFGHAAFLLLGAYGWALLSPLVPGAVAVLASLLVGVAVSWVLGWVCLRFRGYYIGIATVAFGMIVWAVAKNWESLTGGNNGISGIHRIELPMLSSSISVYVVALLLLAFFYWLQEGLRASSLGMSMLASRGDEDATACLGLSVAKIRVVAFIVSAVPTIIAGMFLAQLTTYISPDQFEIPTSISLVAIPIIGGRGWRWAPLLGAAFVVGLPEYVRFLAEYRLVMYGLILTTVALFFPDGFRQLFQLLISWARRRGAGAASGT
jgi:branched-chain amino acid transport system permease protein